MPYITARDGKPVYVRILGRGKPCLILHGFGMHSTHWLPFLWPLRKEFRFFMPDFRGFGKSARTHHNQDCVLTNYADDIADILDAFQLRRVNLAGISMGAFAALQYMKSYGTDRVEAYLNIDQSPFVKATDDWEYGLFGQAGRHKLPLLERLYQAALNFNRDTPFEELPETFRSAFRQELGDFIAYALARAQQKTWIKRICDVPVLANSVLPGSHWQAYMTCLGSYLREDYDMRPLARELDIPVHVLAGMRSDMYPWQGQKYLSDHAPRGEFIPFAKSGHLPMFDQPRLFAQTVHRVFA
ncbi:MAG: alpha/beta hydrolase [Hahellaceae bacterium]|nr:alpha/beta hydrolase [Hahellaceae bacterium]